MAVLEELGSAVASVADRVGSSAVRIGGGWRGGSGVVIGPGAVLTNAHNVRSEELTVAFADGRRAAGKLAGIDVDGDLAVVSVDTGDSPQVEWSTATAHIGTPVFAITLNGSGPRVTLGFRLKRSEGVSRSTRPADLWQPRAYGAAGARLIGQRTRRR